MSSAIPTLSAGAPAGASVAAQNSPKPPPPPPPVDDTPKFSEHHRAATSAASANAAPPALSSTEVSYVQSLLGVLPAQKMAEVMLRTGVPIPEHLGPNVDTTA